MSDTCEQLAPTRRLRKKERTRRQIQTAANELFAQKGFDNVTIAEIAEKADVDVTTFWRHFGSKYGLLYADFEPWLEQFKETFESLPQDLAPFEAGMQALTLTPPVSEPQLDWVRTQIEGDSMPAHIRAGLLLFEDLVRRELTEGIAKRMGVDPKIDPRPFLIADIIRAGASWARVNFLNQQNSQGEHNQTSLDVKEHILDTVRMILKDQ